MKIKLLENQTQNVIYAKSLKISDDLSEDKQEIVNERYHISISQQWFDGVHISTMVINTQSSEDFYYESSQYHIGFLFCLKGSISYYSDLKTKQLCRRLNSNQQNVSADHLNRVVFNVSGHVNCTYIQLTASYYRKITNRGFEDQEEFSPKAITPGIALLLSTIEWPKYSGRLKRIFLESKIFELIIAHLQKKEIAVASFKEEDVRKILSAKQIIESNLQHPYSLMELSRMAGINDYKLKKGFKSLIGHTVFGYLYKIRMERAHYFLLYEKKMVNEVAFLVGYKNAQHFISAFKKNYDVLPGSLNKNH